MLANRKKNITKSVKPFGMKVSYRKKESYSEEELILRAKKNPAHFDALYKKYYKDIFIYIHRRVDRESLAADLAQDTFIKALTNIEKFEYRGMPFSSWLYRIAINQINQHYRSNHSKRVVSVEVPDVREDFEIDDMSVDKEKLMTAMIEEINQLKGDDLILIEMHFFEKKSYKEICSILDIKEGNAKVKVHRIKERIRKKVIK